MAGVADATAGVFVWLVALLWGMTPFILGVGVLFALPFEDV